MSEQQITEADLHAYVDGQLDPARRAEVEAWLADNPQAAARAAAYREQNERLHALFDPVLEEPVPAPMRHAAPRWRIRPLRAAAAVGWMVLGGLLGFALRSGEPQVERIALARDAAVAHVVYAPEVQHPVEVGAAQQQHLVTWLSKRLGAELKAPVLGELGYELVGGRLLPGENGPAAQFMYQDASGQRLTLYVRTDAPEGRGTAFRFAEESGVGVFYWVDGRTGYALSGEVEKDELLRVANAVYRQLNP